MHPTQHLLLTAACQRCRRAVRCCFEMQVTGPGARSSFLPQCLPSPSSAVGAAGAEMGLIAGAATRCRSKQHSTLQRNQSNGFMTGQEYADTPETARAPSA